jgi:hypothetical protein
MERIQTIINYNTFQFFLEGELLIGLPSMKLLIQQQHGLKYSGFSLIDLMKFALKDNWLQL